MRLPGVWVGGRRIEMEDGETMVRFPQGRLGLVAADGFREVFQRWPVQIAGVDATNQRERSTDNRRRDYRRRERRRRIGPGSPAKNSSRGVVDYCIVVVNFGTEDDVRRGFGPTEGLGDFQTRRHGEVVAHRRAGRRRSFSRLVRRRTTIFRRKVRTELVDEHRLCRSQWGSRRSGIILFF